MVQQLLDMKYSPFLLKNPKLFQQTEHTGLEQCPMRSRDKAVCWLLDGDTKSMAS
ncbi:hypothetical protein B7P43_G09466 [Cryptotermes secundus]|uniref:Uncharacterized protein n=1 Tax=Cryptotermes secundus TaxID=105785 RepID=A0A2J7R2S4_9NEOP|nr:hypothetical protein B7P43_G09466 [Cryptotermes secundus]